MKEKASNKERDESLETSDGRRDSSETDIQLGPLPDESISDPDEIWEVEDELYEALSLLRAVRVPGKQKLTMQEAMEAASDQYESYCRWKNNGGPLGQLKARVEEQELFTAMGPPVFRDLNFDWPPLNEGVLQVTTEYEGEEVVLYNLRLHDVPAGQSVYDEPLPNGQHLVLTVARYVTRAAAAGTRSVSSHAASFAINIAIQSQPGENKTSAREKLLQLDNEGFKWTLQDGRADAKDSRTRLPKVTNLISEHPRLSAGITYGLALVLLLCFWIQNARLKSVPPGPAVAQANVTGSRPEIQTTNHDEQSTTQVQDVSHEASQPLLAVVNIRLHEARDEPAKNRRPSTGWQLNALMPAPAAQPGEARMVAVAASETSKVDSDERLTRYRELEERVAAIAAKPHISVRVQNSEMAQVTKAESLRSLFARAFQASPRFKVLNDADQSKAELVIGLRFERMEHASGLVFVDIRDANGKFIWRDFANCMESRPNAHGETFIVDAGGLVSSLEEVMSSSSQN